MTVSIPLCSSTRALRCTEKQIVSGDRTLTFWGGARDLKDAGTSLWCAHAMAADRHQAPHDSSLAGSCVSNNDSSTSLAAACFSQDLLQACEEPITADEGRFCCEAGDFEQQRFEHHISLFEWHQSPWREVRGRS